MYATYAVAKRKPEKNSGLYGIRTLDLCDTGIIIIINICLLKNSSHKHTCELNNNRVSILTNPGKRNKELLDSLIIYTKV